MPNPVWMLSYSRINRDREKEEEAKSAVHRKTVGKSRSISREMDFEVIIFPPRLEAA